MLKEVAADNLVTIKVKCTKSRFTNTFSATWLANTIGNVIVGARVVINPMMVYWNKARKYTLINDMKKRKTSTHMRLSVLQQHLYSLKLLNRNYSLVVTCIKILVSVLIISFMLMFV